MKVMYSTMQENFLAPLHQKRATLMLLSVLSQNGTTFNKSQVFIA